MTQGYTLMFAGQTFLLDCRKAVWWEAKKTLMVADLHFGKGMSFARHDTLLPPVDTLATLEALDALIADWKPARVLALGDSFHRADSYAQLASEEQHHIRRLVENVGQWRWIAGNHDPQAPEGLPGDYGLGFQEAGVSFAHDFEGMAPAEPAVCGHFHPKAAMTFLRRTVRQPCFAWNRTRLVLPSFGAYTGGLSVHADALKEVLGEDFRVMLAGLGSCVVAHARNLSGS